MEHNKAFKFQIFKIIVYRGGFEDCNDVMAISQTTLDFIKKLVS